MFNINGNGNNPYYVGRQNGVNGRPLKQNAENTLGASQSGEATLNSSSSDGFIRTTPSKAPKQTQQSEGDNATVEKGSANILRSLQKLVKGAIIKVFGRPNWVEVDYNGETGILDTNDGGLWGRFKKWLNGLFN